MFFLGFFDALSETLFLEKWKNELHEVSFLMNIVLLVIFSFSLLITWNEVDQSVRTESNA